MIVIIILYHVLKIHSNTNHHKMVNNVSKNVMVMHLLIIQQLKFVYNHQLNVNTSNTVKEHMNVQIHVIVVLDLFKIKNVYKVVTMVIMSLLDKITHKDVLVIVQIIDIQ